jgi:hypothetical protein
MLAPCASSEVIDDEVVLEEEEVEEGSFGFKPVFEPTQRNEAQLSKAQLGKVKTSLSECGNNLLSLPNH